MGRERLGGGLMGYDPRPLPRTRHRVWPIRAVRDAKQPPARDTDEVFRLENCYAQDTEIGPLLVGRPGFWLMGTVGSGAGVQLGSGGNRRVQLIHQLTKRNGTEVSMVLCGGQLYTYNWSTNVWTESVTAANFATASITLSASARCYAVNFADTVVVSDGVNKPWTWDGTAGAGGLVSLTNAVVAYGPPAVYYGKLFFIKNAARGTFIWSEEATANTGYEAGGYNNAWDFVQTATEGLVSLAATNDALYVFRQNSCTAVTGAVTTDFKTTGTREALSPSLGTTAPGSVAVIGDRVVFLDQYGFVQAASLGGGVREIGTGARETLRSIPALNLAVTQTLDDQETGHIKLALAESGNDDPNIELWLDRSDGRFASTVRGYAFTRFGLLKDGSGFPTVVHGGGSSPTTNTGYVYAHDHPGGSTWDDEFQSGTLPVSHVVETPFIGHDTEVDKLFSRGEVAVLPVTSLTGVGLAIRTSYGVGGDMTLEDIDQEGVGLGTFVLGTDTLSESSNEETKRTFGLRDRGRWARLTVTHGTVGEQFQLSELALVSTPVTRRPEVR